MGSNYEDFFTGTAYAVIGNSATRNFPKITYSALKANGSTVFPIDPSTDQINGDVAYNQLGELPEKVDRVIIEVPRDETQAWFDEAVKLGYKDIWVHMGCDTPELKAAANAAGVNLRTGTCAVMYVKQGLSYHSIHTGIMKMTGKY